MTEETTYRPRRRVEYVCPYCKHKFETRHHCPVCPSCMMRKSVRLPSIAKVVTVCLQLLLVLTVSSALTYVVWCCRVVLTSE